MIPAWTVPNARPFLLCPKIGKTVTHFLVELLSVMKNEPYNNKSDSTRPRETRNGKLMPPLKNQKFERFMGISMRNIRPPFNDRR